MIRLRPPFCLPTTWRVMKMHCWTWTMQMKHVTGVLYLMSVTHILVFQPWMFNYLPRMEPGQMWRLIRSVFPWSEPSCAWRERSPRRLCLESRCTRASPQSILPTSRLSPTPTAGPRMHRHLDLPRCQQTGASRVLILTSMVARARWQRVGRQLTTKRMSRRTSSLWPTPLTAR